ncbi:MAG TPA: sigma-70 family RNA polymerase sigma factor [Candidatus Sulfotelmatobacter sp.]|nr:sigma-70 family RNA polymerase sigma factor [Candidatus Sulfotelmatobacter sp.]
MASRGDRLDLPAPQVDLSVTEHPRSETSEELALVHEAQHGDRAAFGRLYERYAPMIHGVLLAKVPVSAVDDLVQDVFIRALRRMSSLRQHASFGAWLATIARNLANDYHRRSAPEEQLPDGQAENDIAAPPSSVDRRRQAATVLEAMRGLPEAYRETLILRFVEGMTGPEIAARTGLSHGSVRVNLHRGMQQLRALLRLTPGNNDPEQENS